MALARYGKILAVASALTLIVVASVALFATIQSLSPYIADLKGQFYTPFPNPTIETLFDRARSGAFLLRLALWPSLVFVALEAAAAYAISTLLSFKGRLAVTRQLIAGAAVSVVISVSVLAALWPRLDRMILP